MASEQFVIRLGVNSTGVTTGINSAVGQVQRLYEGTKRVVEGFLALEAVRWGAEAVKSALELGTQLNVLAQRSNIAVEELQGFQFGVKQAGGDIDELVRGLKDMARAQIDALKGNADLRASFKRYGVSVDDLRNKKPVEIFKRIAEEMGRATATAQVTDDAAAIFGKPSEVLLASFRNGLIESAEEAQKLGLIIKHEVTDELQRAQDEVDILTAKWKKFTATATANTIKNIRGNLEDLRDFIAAGTIGNLAKKAGLPDIVANILSKAVVATSQANDAADDEKRKKKGDQGPAGNNVKKESLAAHKPEPAITDSLARIGGYRGGTGEFNRIPMQQLEVQRRMEVHLSRIAVQTLKGGNGEAELLNDFKNMLRDYRGLMMDIE